MTGLKQRILGRRSASPPDPGGPSPTDPQAAPADVSAEAPPPSLFGSSQSPAGITPDDVPTIAHTTASGTVTPPEQPAPPPADTGSTPPEGPAGADPDAPPRTGFRERGRMRRRLRYLRRAHELGLRDLGGLVFDLRRFRRQRFDLVEAKLQTLTLVDREMRALETTLGDRRPVMELREAGIASCPRCGGLTASDANFCANCGLQIGDAPPVVSAPTPPTAPAVASAPAAPAVSAVSASETGSTPLSAGTAPANGTLGASSVTSGDPLAPPPADR